MLNNVSECLMSDIALIHIATYEYARGVYFSHKSAQDLGFSCGILWKDGIGASTMFGECQTIEDSSMQGLLEYLKNCANKTVIVIQDIHRVYNDPLEMPLLQEAVERISLGEAPVNIIGISTSTKIPEELERNAYIFLMPFPTRSEIKGIVKSQMSAYGITLGDSIINRLAEAFNGLIGDEIRIVINRIVAVNMRDDGFIDESAISFVLQQKKQVIQKSGLIEFIEPDVGIDDAGGLHNLKLWLKNRKEIFDDLEKASKFGLRPPKGILLFGMPGSGKSLTAKITANYYNLPLLRVDMGTIYGQKSPEEAIGRVISIADTIAPCVLWIDELEKALAGAEIGSNNDVAIKILGILLTWMQERTAPVFIVATANDISMIRPELYRDGRIDEKFFLGFLESDHEQIEQILKIHLRKRLKGEYDNVIKNIDINAIAKKMAQMVVASGGREEAGYTGANLEALVEKVLMERFIKDRPTVETRDFIRMLNSVKPQHGKPIKLMFKNAVEIEALHA